MIVIESERMTIKQCCMTNACNIALFFKKNKIFHNQFNPKQKNIFYSSDFWIQEAQRLDNEIKRNISCKLFMFDKYNPANCIGSIDLEEFWRHPIESAFLGFALDQNYTGKGYMTEALQAVFPFYKKHLRLHKIFATTDIANAKSQALLERLGFLLIGTINNYIFINNQWQSHNILYKIL